MITENDIIEALKFWETEQSLGLGTNKMLCVKDSDYENVAKVIIRKILISNIDDNLSVIKNKLKDVK